MKQKVCIVAGMIFIWISPLRAGLLFDDPLLIEATPVHHTFSKDELEFRLLSKVIASDVHLKIELIYKDKTTTVFKSDELWTGELSFGGRSFRPAVTIQLPENLTGLMMIHLTGTFRTLGEIGTGKELRGFKIDSTFDPSHTYSVQ